ncbi:lipoprotein [Kaistella yonginensis]|uniref:lipoprotein n=1 Tax=Kaistella yonginensis TaxID=658267 RepID=UPI0025B5A698|nr:lipoprotein [Kaistella yonginensis]MDN3606491.1 lipoprotein [Kaistella yonginensis]
MKKYILVILPLAALTSCSEIEETINQQIEKTTTSVKEQAQNAVKETLDDTISNSINSLTNAEHAQFQEVFPKGEPTMISDFKGKKFSFPNGSPAYVFKYKADKDLLIPYLEQQETLDEEKSDKVAKKIDGKVFMDKLSFVEKFLPANTIDMSFLEDIKNDKSIEYYKLKRFPNSSTIIYNPKTQQVFQFVEVSK